MCLSGPESADAKIRELFFHSFTSYDVVNLFSEFLLFSGPETAERKVSAVMALFIFSSSSVLIRP
jgi:hypothetical protein